MTILGRSLTLKPTLDFLKMDVIPFLDLKSGYTELKEIIDEQIQEVLHSGRYIGGDKLLGFEVDWAAYCGSSYSVGVASGLDALVLALKSLGIGEDDEVIVPSHTFIATWLAVTNVGAKPIPVDVCEDDYNLNVDLIAGAITTKCKAIITVHLYGQPSDLDAISAIAKDRGLFLIEDAAQAHGALYKSKKIGSHSDVIAWSFYPGKNLGAFGDGGAITTNRNDIYQKIKTLQNYGSREKYVHTEIGYNSRLDPLQAAVLQCKLNSLDQWNQRRCLIASIYNNQIKNNLITKPIINPFCKSVWHLYVIRVESRRHFQDYMKAAGIQTLIHYPIPPYSQKAYKYLNYKQVYPVASYLSERIVSLPIYPHLDHEKAYYIADKVNSYNFKI